MTAGWQEQPGRSPRFWRAQALDRYPRLRHVFTPSGFNLSLRSGGDRPGSPARRAALCRMLDAAPPALCSGEQVHGIKIARVAGDVDPAGPTVLPATDGLVTDAVGVPLLAQSADCPLVLLYAPARHVLGLAHTGWRGTLADMPGRLARKLADEFAALPGALVAVVAPSAGPCCYEIRDDVYSALAAVRADAERLIRRDGATMYLDMWTLIAAQLVEAGVPAASVHLPCQCSICDERFFSYRRQGPGAGHAGLIACLQ